MTQSLRPLVNTVHVDDDTTQYHRRLPDSVFSRPTGLLTNQMRTMASEKPQHARFDTSEPQRLPKIPNVALDPSMNLSDALDRLDASLFAIVP